MMMFCEPTPQGLPPYTNGMPSTMDMMDRIHICDSGYSGHCGPATSAYHQHQQQQQMDPVKMEPDMMDVDCYMGPGGGMLTPHGGSSPSQMIGGSAAAAAAAARARKNKEDKTCGVCGDRALGYNFDAISCESCKAFFRRNAPKGLDYFKCPYDEKCKMDISNRRFCKRCRLKKCFEIGMRKEYILTEEEKARKRAKIEENRYTKGCPPPPTMMRESERSPSSVKSVEVTTSLAPELSQEDQDLIEELRKAYSSSLGVKIDKEPRRDMAKDMTDLANICEVSVRRVIDMAKKVQSFKALPQHDQISLLKGGSIELLILRSVIAFDKEKQQFLEMGDSEDVSGMSLEQLRRAENGTGLFDEHMKFVKSLLVDLNADQVMMILLLIISLFSPDRPNLLNKEAVWEQQEKYSLLLKKYLETQFPLAIAQVAYPKFLMKLTEIRNLNEGHSQVLLKVNPEGIQPLMQEVLDL